MFGDFLGGFGTLFGGSDGNADLSSLPLIGTFMGDSPNQQNLQSEFQAAEDEYRRFAPLHAEAQRQGLENQLAAYGPANAMLGAMMGPGAQIDMSQVFASPFPMGHPGNPNTPVQQGAPGSKKKDDVLGFIERPFEGPIAPIERATRAL
jgi:hypothetical protein